MLSDICHVSRVKGHMSHVTCHKSHVTCLVSHVPIHLPPVTYANNTATEPFPAISQNDRSRLVRDQKISKPYASLKNKTKNVIRSLQETQKWVFAVAETEKQRHTLTDIGKSRLNGNHCEKNQFLFGFSLEGVAVNEGT